MNVWEVLEACGGAKENKWHAYKTTRRRTKRQPENREGAVDTRDADVQSVTSQLENLRTASATTVSGRVYSFRCHTAELAL